MAQTNISEIKQRANCYYVEITRKNRSKYQVWSDEYLGMLEYRQEFLEFQKQKGKTR